MEKLPRKHLLLLSQFSEPSLSKHNHFTSSLFKQVSPSKQLAGERNGFNFSTFDVSPTKSRHPEEGGAHVRGIVQGTVSSASFKGCGRVQTQWKVRGEGVLERESRDGFDCSCIDGFHGGSGCGWSRRNAFSQEFLAQHRRWWSCGCSNCRCRHWCLQLRSRQAKLRTFLEFLLSPYVSVFFTVECSLVCNMWLSPFEQNPILTM